MRSMIPGHINDRDVVEVAREDGVDETGQREQHRSQHHHRQRQRIVGLFTDLDAVDRQVRQAGVERLIDGIVLEHQDALEERRPARHVAELLGWDANMSPTS